MYEQHFGLKRRPFPSTPDTSLYYPSSVHESALTALCRGLEEGESFGLLTGETGTGKTLIAYALLERIGDKAVSAFLTNSHFADRSSLLQAILYDLGLPHEEAGEQTLRLRLTDQLLKNCAGEKHTIVVIDEAHHLSIDLLEELRLLTNLEAGDGKAVQFVLCAQPSILALLKDPALGSLQQRIVLRSALGALAIEEACDYLLHHLRWAGGKPEKIFDDDALKTIARATHGIPRCLNQAAHQALVLAHAGELEKVDAEAALEALTTLGMAPSEEPTTEKDEAHPKIQTFLRTA